MIRTTEKKKTELYLKHQYEYCHLHVTYREHQNQMHKSNPKTV